MTIRSTVTASTNVQPGSGLLRGTSFPNLLDRPKARKYRSRFGTPEHESRVQYQRMATSSTEPPPKHVKLRYRALAYVRRIGRHHRPRATSRRSFADTDGARPPIQVNTKGRFSNLGGVAKRPVVRTGSRKSFADSRGSKSGIAQPSNLDFNEAASTPGGIKVSTRNSTTRKKFRTTRENHSERRHRFLASLHDHGGHRFRLFCGCCIEQDAVDPEETPRFHWGVGFDDSYYRTPNYQRLSSGTRFRLELCGLHRTSRSSEPVGISSVGARADSFDSGFGFTCASPVSCPPPLGLAPALPTMLQLRSRDSGKVTLNTENSRFSSTGFKRKAPTISSGYPSYTPTTPPSPVMNDFAPSGTFNNTRVRTRVSVGCNGWFLNDDDLVIVGWHRRSSSGEVKLLSQVTEASRESDADFDRELPKRYKRSQVSSSLPASSPTRLSIQVPAVVPSPEPRVSIVLLSQDGSVSSSNGKLGWLDSSGIALVPLPTSPLPPSTTTQYSYTTTPPPQIDTSRSSGSVSQTYDSSLAWQRENSNTANDDCVSSTKRLRNTGSSSNSSGGFGFLNMRGSMHEEERRESLHNEERGSTSLTARFSASLRLTRSHSPRSLRRALSSSTRRRTSRSASRSRGRQLLHLGSKVKSAPPPPPTPVRIASSTSIVFIDCPP